MIFERKPIKKNTNSKDTISDMKRRIDLNIGFGQESIK